MESWEKLNAFTPSEFMVWLEAVLRSIYDHNNPNRNRTYDFRQLDIPIGDSHLDAIESLQKRLSPAGQASFKSGLVKLLEDSSPGSLPVNVVQDLILLVAICKPDDAAKVLLQVCEGPWGQSDKAMRYDCCSGLLGLDIPEEEMQQILEEENNELENKNSEKKPI